MRLLLAVVLLAAAPAAQREIWASPTGDDATGDGTDVNPYRTVTRCLTAAAPSGDTIRLTAGAFGDDDRIHITGKSVTVRGAGIGQTVVRPHATLYFTLPGGLPPGTPQEHAVAVVADGPVVVNLYDLTVDNANRVPASSGRSYDVMYLAGADGTVDGCELRGARDNPLAANDAPAAVMVRGDGGSDPCQVTVRRCHLHDFGKGGVLALFDAQVTIEENDVVGAGALAAPDLAQLGVQLAFGATGSVRKNRIRDLELTTAAGIGVGIQLLDAAAGVVLEGNRVVRCERGIETVQTGSTVRALTVRDNFATESDTGIFVDHDGATLVGNTLQRARLLDARDDTGTPTVNTWSDNCWAQWNGTGGKAIAGLSALSDATPRRGLDQTAAPVTVPLAAVPVAVVAAALDASRLDFAAIEAPASASAMPTLAVGLQTAASVFTVTTLGFGAAAAQPTALVAGEFNGAAGVDLAATTDESRFYVFANDGNGGFSLLHEAALPAAAVGPAALAAGDVDGNGLDDLVVASIGSLGGAGAGVVLANGTGGTSWTATTLPGTFTGQCKGVALARIDAGSSLDVALTEGSGTTGSLHVLVNDGAGVFTALTGSPFALGPDPTACTVADVDRDGLPDLLATCSNAAVPLVPGTLHLLRQTASGFAAHTYRTGRLPAHVLGLDLGGDADPDTVRQDVAFVSLGDNSIGLLDAHEAFGFTANLVGVAGTSPRALAAGDFDGNGGTDLVVADGGGQAVHVLLARATARADLFGTGCPGQAGRSPFIAPHGTPALPRHPNSTFGVRLENARAFAVAVLLASTQAPTTSAPCSLLLPRIDLVWTAFTDVAGEARVVVPVPPGPATLAGLELFFQGVVLDDEGRLGDFLAATEGLRLRIGR